MAEEAAAKQKEQEEKRKKLEEAEKKRQAQVKPRVSKILTLECRGNQKVS